MVNILQLELMECLSCVIKLDGHIHFIKQILDLSLKQVGRPMEHYVVGQVEVDL
jgi:hypothetical protein